MTSPLTLSQQDSIKFKWCEKMLPFLQRHRSENDSKFSVASYSTGKTYHQKTFSNSPRIPSWSEDLSIYRSTGLNWSSSNACLQVELFICSTNAGYDLWRRCDLEIRTHITRNSYTTYFERICKI